MPMKNGAAVLGVLRSKPKTAISAWGFISRGDCLSDQVGGNAALRCVRYGQTSIYQIQVARGGTDYYIPYRSGEARYCDVPRGRPDGTLVVTFPMNGCALEVHRRPNGDLRFFHDADGKSMAPLPMGGHRVRVFRATYGDMSGASEPAIAAFQREQSRAESKGLHFMGNFEHNIYCIKISGKWQVYASACVLSRMVTDLLEERANDAWQIKNDVPYFLGEFDD